MTEQPFGGPNNVKGRDKPGGRIASIPKAFRGAHYTLEPRAGLWEEADTLIVAPPQTDLAPPIERTEPTVQTYQSESPGITNPPTFGEPIPQQEQEKWLTIGKDAWLYDSPIWDTERIRLGRTDKPVAVKVLQELKGPNGRLATQVLRTYKDREGKEQSRTFWVHPKPGGFDGMPKKDISRPTLKLDKLPQG